MTPQQIDAMKLALEALKKCHYYMIDAGLPNQSLLNEAFTAYKALEGLKDHAMREVQRLGQEIEQKIGCVNHDCDQCKAQPEQEPVAWMDVDGNVSDNNDHKCFPIPLYTQPPQRKPLTKEEMFEAIRPLYSSEMSARIAVDHSEDEYRAIEAAHGIKENT
jgi:hypothetical protein